MGADPEHTRQMHEALAVASRVQLLDVLRTSGRALDVGELARFCGLHISTVRFHLRILNEAGLVHRGPEPARAPARSRRAACRRGDRLVRV